MENQTKKKKSKYTKLKKVWIPKKPSLEPRKMNQFWVPKSTSPEPETMLVNEVRKKDWNQKSLRKKKRVLKPQVGCFTFDQKFSEVRYALKPTLKWVPKSFFFFVFKSDDLKDFEILKVNILMSLIKQKT